MLEYFCPIKKLVAVCITSKQFSCMDIQSIQNKYSQLRIYWPLPGNGPGTGKKSAITH